MQVSLVAFSLFLALHWPRSFHCRCGYTNRVPLYAWPGIGNIIESLLTLAGIVYLSITRNIHLVPVALTFAGSNLVSQSSLMAIAWWKTRPWSINLHKVSIKTAREVLSLGGSALSITASNMFYSQGMGIAIGRLLGLGAVGIYGVAINI